MSDKWYENYEKKKVLTDYEIIANQHQRKVIPIICVYCNCCGLDAVDRFEDLGFCIICQSYYEYLENGFPSPHVENEFTESLNNLI